MSVMNWIQKGPKVRASPTLPFIWAPGWHLNTRKDFQLGIHRESKTPNQAAPAKWDHWHSFNTEFGLFLNR